jgi:hypothetical protein
MGLGANKSPPTFAPAHRCKSLICTSGNSTVIADKSDNYSPAKKTDYAERFTDNAAERHFCFVAI